MRLPEPLLKALHAERVVPFIGAGLSYFFGNPSWNDLLLCIAKDKRIGITIIKDDIENKDPLQVAESFWQFYKNKYYISTSDELKKLYTISDPISLDYNEFIDKKVMQKLSIEFNNIVVECLQSYISSSTKAVDKVEELKKLGNHPFRTIVTTNYDENLESEIFKDLEVVYPGVGKELSLDEKKNILYKIHGHIGEPASIVLTQSQYYNFMYKLGFYKSKLYTIFATNVIIMLGYSFRDINVHDIYFQYRRDYDGIIDKLEKEQPKAYLVLTDYDKGSLGSYYELYKQFLTGCGIIVIDEGFADLPGFVELLDQDMKAYKAMLSSKGITAMAHFDTIKSFIVLSINNEPYDVDKKLAPEYLSAIVKIFEEPSSLIELGLNIQFDFTGKMPEIIGLSLLDSILNCVLLYPDMVMTDEFNQLVYQSLIFADESRFMINDFYHYPKRFKRFINFSKQVVDLRLSEEQRIDFANKFSEALRYSGNDFGKCYGSAKEIETNVKDISEAILSVYIDERLKVLATKEKHDMFVSKTEIRWLQYFVNVKPMSDDLKQKISNFIKAVNDNNLDYPG